MQSTLEQFFNDVGKTSLLTREEEVELSQRIEQGDEIARKRMIRANIRLAISIAKKYQNKGCDLEDLIQESNIGLMKAVERFDWRRGFKFSTYACWWIKQAVRRHVSTYSSAIKLPPYTKTLLWKIKKVSEEYHDEFNVYPTQDEVADLLGVSIRTLKNIISCASSPISLDSKRKYSSSNGGSEGRSLAESIPDKNAPDIASLLDLETVTQQIRVALNKLTDREEKIIRMRFGISEDSSKYSDHPITTDELEIIKMRGDDK